MTEVQIQNEQVIGHRIYFDLSLHFNGGHSITINRCFAEQGDRGDWMLRFPTKKMVTQDGFYQIIWMDEVTFEIACTAVRDHFAGRK